MNAKVTHVIAGLFMLSCMATAYGEIRETDWPDPSANHVFPYKDSGLSHGPMLGRPTATGIRVWVRTVEPMEFKVVYNTDLPLSANMKGVTGSTLAKKDNTGFVDIPSLKPNTRYYYGIVIDGHLADTRMNFEPGFTHFRTLPDETVYRNATYNPDGLFNFTFATGYGNRQTSQGGKYGQCPAYPVMLREMGDTLRFFLMNGDYIYEECRTWDNRPHTTDMFRADYKSYMSRDTGMSEFLRYIPMLFTYDDHETFSDLEGTGEVGLGKGKWLYRDVSLGPWYEYAGWANFHGPHQQSIFWGEASVKAESDILEDDSADFTKLDPDKVSTIHLHEPGKNAGVYELVEVVDAHRLKLRPAFKASETCQYSIGTYHYFDFKVSNCHFFVVDTRGQRTRYLPEKAHDPNRFILGEKQKQWLKDGVRKTDADFVFVVSSVSWMIYHTNFHVGGMKKLVAGRSVKEDGFTGAVHERDELLKCFDGLNKQVILLTGDLHNAFAVQISDNVWEFLIGPINSANHPIATAANPPYGGWFDSEGWKVKIKWVSGFPNEVSYFRLRHKYFCVVQVNNVMKSGMQNSEGLHWVEYDKPQVVVRVHDGYAGDLVYAEGISMADITEKPK